MSRLRISLKKREVITVDRLSIGNQNLEGQKPVQREWGFGRVSLPALVEWVKLSNNSYEMTVAAHRSSPAIKSSD